MYIQCTPPDKCRLTLIPRISLAVIIVGLALFFSVINTSHAADLKYVPGHIPKIVSQLQPTGRLLATDHLRLAIGLPLRNEAELDDLLRQIYDPASPNYHQYLTLEQFTERFGPTEKDYQAIIAFATANGLTVSGTYPNRMVADVSGSVEDIERVFHLTLNVYRHPKENRTFYAPDVEPSADLPVPVLHIAGLDNYSLKRPMATFKKIAAANADVVPSAGSGPGSSYMGLDFRAAYAPGVTLSGNGQSVALVEFDGYHAPDITAYIQKAGLTNYTVNITNVPVAGGVSVPGAGNGEVCLDIEMVLAMSPGVTNILVYEAPNPTPWVTMLSAMTNKVNGVLPKQISSSWGGGSPDPTSEGVFKQMAALGQSYFNASGDYDAFNGSIPFPSDSTNITEVGGTVLSTTGPLGSFVSETVWNDRTVNPNGGNWGSSGGISPTYPIPVWQQSINMTTNLGSTTMRNVPDVALTAKNIFIIADTNQTEIASGTSCAAPLWAGFIALANQQAATAGRSSVGFINPAIYAIGKGTNYNANFHDVTTGDNTWSGSPTKFYATNGFDLCTGWGSPTGQSLIDALAGPADTLGISPLTGFNAYGATGGTFNVTSQLFTLTNTSGSSLNWQIGNTSAWLMISSTSGTIPASGFATTTIGLTGVASNLAAGTYTANVWFTNKTSSVVQARLFTLQAVPPLVVTPATGFTSAGAVGGPFNNNSQNLFLTNLGTASLNWSVINTSLWLNATPGSGTLSPSGGNTTVAVALNATANNLAAGVYSASLWFSNQTTHAAQNVPFVLQIGQTLIQNGGFETGDFSFWSLAQDTGSFVDDGSVAGITPHSGTYLAALGQAGSVGFLSQTLSTIASQPYLLSLWLNSTGINTPNEFSVSWNGTTLFDQVNIGSIGWTNLQFIVTATSSSTVLQFGERNDPWYLGLDDVSAVPIPFPSFRSVAKMGNSNAVVLVWNTMANLSYQVQYSTNLAATNWIILSTNTAVGSTLSVTNGYGANPRRFYRIRQLP